MKKINTITVFVSIIVIGLVFWLTNLNKQEETEKPCLYQIESAGLMAEEPLAVSTHQMNVENSAEAGVPALVSAQPSSQDRVEKYTKLSRYYHECQQKGIPVGDKPQEGMVSPSKALSVAENNNPRKYDKNQQPTITLVEDIYIVEFWKRKNPYREKKRLDSMGGIDAWSGELLALGRSLSGGQFYWIDKETVTSEVSKQIMKTTIKSLDKRAVEGAALNSELQPGMVSPEEAVKKAREQVNGRDFDRSREPQVVLVDDIYMVVFWRYPGSTARHHGKLYDTRVGIDAQTGAFIATEITKEKR